MSSRQTFIAALFIASVLVLAACDSRRPTDGFADSTTPASEAPVPTRAEAPSVPNLANSATPPPHTEIVEATELPEDFELMFNHDGTCARCIDYRIHMYADGRAVFRNTEAEINHPRAGIIPLPAVKAERDIEPKIMLNMARQLGQIGFLDIDPKKIEDNCELTEGHRPLVTMKLTWNGRSNIIKHDHRCDPDKLGDIRDPLLRVERTIRTQTKLGDYLTRLRETAAEKYMPPEP